MQPKITYRQPPHLYRNDGGNANNWLTVTLAGTKSNRSALGAVVRVTSASGAQWQMVRSGSSYCSQSQLALTFGLGKDPEVTALDIEWPSGARQRLAKPVPGDQGAVIPVQCSSLAVATEGSDLVGGYDGWPATP